MIGLSGMLAAVLVGVLGWVLAGRAAESVTVTMEPLSRVVRDLADSIAASEVLFDRTTEAIESIESATRSAVRTVDSVSDVLTETAGLAGGDIADSLDSAVDTLPGLVSTARVIDTTMRALSFVGVDYDPDVPLHDAIAGLQASLAPIPGQLRDQAALLEDVNTDLAAIADDGRALSAVLLETRLDMADAGRVLASARANADSAVERIEAIQADISTFDTMARWAAVAVAVALLAAASAPFLVGLHLTSSVRQEPADQAAT